METGHRSARRSINKTSVIFWAVAVLAPLVWLWPRLAHPGFGMIDDPADLEVLARMKEHFWSWLGTDGIWGERHYGRFRPAYWLMRFLFYFLPFGFNPLGHATIHFIQISLAVSFAYVLASSITQRPAAGLTACLLWVFSVPTIENYSRLGPQEVWQVLFLGAASVLIFGVLQKPEKRTPVLSYALISLFLFLCYFSKETSVVLFPFSVIILLGGWIFKFSRRRENLIFFVINAAFFSLQRFLAPPLSGYVAEHFEINTATLGRNALYYAKTLTWHWLTAGLVISFLARGIKSGRRFFEEAPNRWAWAFLLLGLGFWAPLLLWTEQAPRYLLVSEYFFVLFASLELQKLLAVTHISRWIIRLLLLLTVSLPVGVVMQKITNVYRHAGEKTTPEALAWLAKNAPNNADVWILEQEMELLRSSAVYLQRFYRRPDLTIHSMSPYAPRYQMEGFNIVPIGQLSKETLERIDYIFWNRRGPERAALDLMHEKIMEGLIQTPYGRNLESVYREIEPAGETGRTGTEIWKVRPVN